MAFLLVFANIPRIFPGGAPPAGGGSTAMFFVYAIYNRSANKFYVGQTFDLKKRLNEHNQKTFKGYTSQFQGGWQIVYKEEIESRAQALKREKQLKSYRGRQFVKLHIPK